MPADSRIQTVQLNWYDASPNSPVEDWLLLTAQHLPAAHPRRYGLYEPLSHRLNDPSALTELTLEDDLVFFSTKIPCVGGSFSRDPGIWNTSIELLGPPLREQPELRSAVRDLFVTYAEARACFLATAEVLAGVHWDGRSVSYDGRSQSTLRLDDDGKFLGLPPYPVWWTWYGEAYRKVVAPYLDPAEVEEHPAGLFHQAGADPVRRSKLPDPLPAELRVHGARRDLARYPNPVRPAAIIPVGLPGT